MRSGPKPLPSNIRRLRGDPGKRGYPAEEPKPKPRRLRAPKGLAPRQQAHWRKLAGVLHAVGVTSDLDEAALRLLVDAWDRYETAIERCAEEGLVIDAPNGMPMQNPHLVIANKAHHQVMRLLAEFGMTPSSRTRVRGKAADEGEPQPDVFD